MPTSTSRTFKIIVFPKEKQGFFKKSSFEVGIDFGCHLDANLASFSFQNPLKSYKNQVPRSILKLIDFGFDFWSIWAPFWEPSWSHVAHQDAAKTPPRRPKTPPRRPTKLSRRSQDTKTPSRGLPFAERVNTPVLNVGEVPRLFHVLWQARHVFTCSKH